MIGTMAAKKRVVRKNPKPVERKKPPTLEELRRKPNTSVPLWCLWCWTEKSHINHACSNCGSYGTTSTPQSVASHVYVEDIPA